MFKTPARKALTKNLKNIYQEMQANGQIKTQAEFATFLDMSQSFMSTILNCKCNISLNMLEKIADKVNRQPYELLNHSLLRK